MSYEPQPFYDDDGTYLGTQFPADDGGAVIVDDDGEIIAAVDGQGTAVDPGAYVFADGDEEYDDVYDDPQLAEIQAQMADLEQRMNEPLPPMQIEHQMPDLGEVWPAAFDRDAANLEHVLGRELTQREMWNLMEDHWADAEAGLQPDAIRSALKLEIGAKDGTHEGRVERMVELMADSDRDERGEMYGDPPPRRAEAYDTNSNVGDRGHSARVALAMDTIDGHDTEDRIYDSSQTYEED